MAGCSGSRVPQGAGEQGTSSFVDGCAKRYQKFVQESKRTKHRIHREAKSMEKKVNRPPWKLCLCKMAMEEL